MQKPWCWECDLSTIYVGTSFCMLQWLWECVFLIGNVSSLTSVLHQNNLLKCGPACAQRPSNLLLLIPRKLVIPEILAALFSFATEHLGTAEAMWREGVKLEVPL